MPTLSSAPYLAAKESPAESRGALVERVATEWQHAVRAALQPLDLTHAQFRLLVAASWLSARQEAVRQSEIAGLANTDPVMTSEVLRTLEARGLILRGPHPSDRRARAVTVTGAGGQLADRAARLMDVVEAKFFERGMAAFGGLAKALKKGGRGE
jgi:DNA-binding MarR family transcriptional regulator